MEIDFRHDTITVGDLIHRYKNKELGLEPGFQRRSVWQPPARKKLIDSVLHKYPLPSIFLYCRKEGGKMRYDVIDGKQRIESLLMFIGEKRGNEPFALKSRLPDEEKERSIDWETLKSEEKEYLITGYKLHAIEVDGELADIIDLFVRINSTGKALTPEEKNHAKYYNSPFLKKAHILAKKWQPYLLDKKILSSTQISRMKHVGLVCELLVAAKERDVTDKKRAVDEAMADNSIKDRVLEKAASDVGKSLKNIKTIFPNLHSTRFRKISDFYSLAVLLQKLERESLVLTDKRLNQRADELLRAFSTHVDNISERHSRTERILPEISPEEGLYRRYLATVYGNSDGLGNRRDRENILRGVLESLFQKKDNKRSFSPEQRRILWNSTDERRCVECDIELRWEDFTIDHINPHSKGGRTALDNADLMCRSCNSRKGSRRTRLAA